MKIILIDSDHMLYYCTYPNKVPKVVENPITGENQEVTELVPKTLDEVYISANLWLNDIFTRTEATHYLGFLGGYSSFRKDINPEYKANRAKLIPPAYIKELKDYLINKWKFIVATDGVEADDLVNISERVLIERSFDPADEVFSVDVLRVSNDKDVVNLVGKCFSPVKKEFFDTAIDEAYTYFWKSMIIGDTADNIKGIEGKGPKFAEQLFTDIKCPPARILKAYIEKYGESLGIENYYKNYKCLKILEQHPNKEWKLPELIKIE